MRNRLFFKKGLCAIISGFLLAAPAIADYMGEIATNDTTECIICDEADGDFNVSYAIDGVGSLSQMKKARICTKYFFSS